MSQQSQGTNSSPADLPMKRKRGRPRKDESMVQGENMNAMPGYGPDSARKNKLSAGASEKVEDDMVGQVVSGVIDGSFDAGYLLNVKVGDTDTQLRGVVFLPGRFVPITPANDVAPHVTMLQRKEIPILACNMQTPAPGSTSQSKQCQKPPVDLRNLAPIFPGQVPPDELQSTVQIAKPKQIASVTASPADNLPRNDKSPSLLRKGTPQRASESGFENSLSEQNSKHTAHFDSHVLIDHIPSDKLQSGNLAAFSHQHVSVMVPLAENLPKNDMCPPLESKVIPQTSESVLDIPGAEHCMKQFLELKDREAVFPGQVPHLELHSAVSITLDSLSASVTLPLADNLAKNHTGPSLENEVTQLTSESGLVIPPSISTQPVEQKNQGAFPDQAPAFDIQSADPMELDNQHTSSITPLGDNSGKNDSGSSLEEKPLQLQTSVPGFGISSSIQDNTQVVKPNCNAPILSERVLSFGLQPGTLTTLDKQPLPTSDMVPLAEKLPGEVTGPSWEGKLVSPQTLEIFPLEQGNTYKQQPIHQETHFDLQSAVQMTLGNHSAKSWNSDKGPCLEPEVMPQQGFLCELGDQSASLMGQVKFDKVVQGAEVLHDFVSSDLVKSSSNHAAAEPEPASEPSIDMLLGTVSRVPEVQHQAVGSDFKLNALIHEEAKKPDIELTGE